MTGYCKHEVEPKSIEYDKTYGRVGICKKCGCKVYAQRVNPNPKRTRVKMKKKERRKLNKLKNAERKKLGG